MATDSQLSNIKVSAIDQAADRNRLVMNPNFPDGLSTWQVTICGVDKMVTIVDPNISRKVHFPALNARLFVSCLCKQQGLRTRTSFRLDHQTSGFARFDVTVLFTTPLVRMWRSTNARIQKSI
jgi:hypothetical protein